MVVLDTQYKGPSLSSGQPLQLEAAQGSLRVLRCSDARVRPRDQSLKLTFPFSKLLASPFVISSSFFAEATQFQTSLKPQTECKLTTLKNLSI
jgi:hypothetical protein